MNFKSLGSIVAAGLATFLIVTGVVAQVLQSRIAFSLLVGIPVGVLVGAVAAGAVAWGIVDGAPERRRRIASSFGAFAIAVLAVIAVGILLSVGTAMSIVIGTIVGLITAVVVYHHVSDRARAGCDGALR